MMFVGSVAVGVREGQFKHLVYHHLHNERSRRNHDVSARSDEQHLELGWILTTTACLRLRLTNFRKLGKAIRENDNGMRKNCCISWETLFLNGHPCGHRLYLRVLGVSDRRVSFASHKASESFTTCHLKNENLVPGSEKWYNLLATNFGALHRHLIKNRLRWEDHFFFFANLCNPVFGEKQIYRRLKSSRSVGKTWGRVAKMVERSQGPLASAIVREKKTY